MERTEGSQLFPIGSALPEFTLPCAQGGDLSSSSYFKGAPATLIVFTCNHCPYVKGSENMLYDTIRQFTKAGLRVALISANDPIQYPEDSFEKMQEKAETSNLPAPYLFDETQSVARSFDAQCTPECYLFDGDHHLVYHGAINNSPKFPEQANNNFLKEAISSLINGVAIKSPFVHPIGCSIKWKG